MSSTQSQAKRFESAVSICLLAVIFLIGLGVFLKQSNTDIGRFGIDTTAVSKFDTRNSKSEIPFELSSLLPVGFKTPSAVKIHTAENLYEKINGKAPFYTESGFEKLFTQLFVSEDGRPQMELYLFDMGSVKNSFPFTAFRKGLRFELLPAMGFAYRTSNALYFAHGKYYVEFVGFSESTELFKAIVEVGQKLRTDLAVDDTEIAELGLFPPENIVEGSIKLYLKNVFGFEGLTDTFTAQYNLNGEAITAFFSSRPDGLQAEETAEKYYKFLIDNGGENVPTTKLQTKLVDFYDTTEIIFTTGPFVAGIHEAENRQAAEKLAEILFNKLNEVVRTNSERTKQ